MTLLGAGDVAVPAPLLISAADRSGDGLVSMQLALGYFLSGN